MKSKLDTDTTPKQKMERFETALGRILTVSKDELNRRIAKDEEIRRSTKAVRNRLMSASVLRNIR